MIRRGTQTTLGRTSSALLGIAALLSLSGVVDGACCRDDVVSCSVHTPRVEQVAHSCCGGATTVQGPSAACDASRGEVATTCRCALSAPTAQAVRLPTERLDPFVNTATAVHLPHTLSLGETSTPPAGTQALAVSSQRLFPLRI